MSAIMLKANTAPNPNLVQNAWLYKVVWYLTTLREQSYHQVASERS